MEKDKMNKNQESEELHGMIGLEIHGYLRTIEKLFCSCQAHREKGTLPNKYICPICTAQPGSKPMLPNEEAVKKAAQIGLMLGCTINKTMKWQRKHYNWPDLPKGYQNTLSGAGAIPIGEKGRFMGIKIRSMHLEEDPASWEPDTGKVDYNRSGLPLVEIITEPDFSTAEEVKDWLQKLIHALSYLKAVDSNAGIKVDVNVSIPNKTERVEIKNVSSIENIGSAINYELERQKKEGGKSKETRRYDEAKGKTIVMRTKEETEDYRFIRDPDLQNIVLNNEFIQELKNKIPEMPEIKLEKLIKKYKLSSKDAETLSKHIDLVEFFEKVAEKIDAKFVAPWITIELLRFLNYNKKKLEELTIKPEHFIELLKLVKEGKITSLKGKEILNKFYPASFMPLASESKITNEKEIEKIAEKIISSNPKAAADYKNGEKKALDFLMGCLMKETQKRADYAVAKRLLEKLLKKE